MNAIINAALARSRPILLVLGLVLVAGSVTYITIPKEADPDVAIPIIYVSIPHDGISPEDAERLLLRPMEKELRTIEGLKELRSQATEGLGTVTLEFEAGFDADQALSDVREKVDVAKAELPTDTEEPSVHEVNVALFPVIVVTLYGDVPERTLVAKARDIRDKLEGLPGILEVDIAGDREDLLEVVIDPVRLEAYNQSAETLFEFVARNNQLVAAGALDSGRGRFSIKVPGLFENVYDVLDLPIKTAGDRVVTFADIGLARRTFKDPSGYARVNGQPAVALEVSKRIGTNIIDTIAEVRALVESEREAWPSSIRVNYSQDKSEDIRTMLKDLQNNVIAAVLLVMIVVVAWLAQRCSGRGSDSRLVSGRHHGPGAHRIDHQHRGVVLVDHGGRDAGRRRDCGDRARRPENGGRTRAPGSLRGGGATHVLANHRRHRHHSRRLYAVAVLAGDSGRVHEISPHHIDRNPGCLAGDGAYFYPYPRVVVWQTGTGQRTFDQKSRGGRVR